jgi:hypothetical protein
MAVEKISISIDEEVLAQARACAEDEGVSLSAWLVEAARERAKLLGWRRLIREYEDEFGAFTAEERVEARAWVAEGERQLDELRAQRGR